MTGSALQSDGRCGGDKERTKEGVPRGRVKKFRRVLGRRIFKVALPPRREAQNQEIRFSGFLKMAFPSRREAHFREIKSPVSFSVFPKRRSRLDRKLIFSPKSRN